MNSFYKDCLSPPPSVQENSKEKEVVALKKLISFIGIAALAFVTFIQVLGLWYNYTNPPVEISLTFTDEEVPVPSVTVCFDLRLMIKEEFTLKYGIDTLSLLDQQWQKFDFENQSLTQVFKSAVAFPIDFLEYCAFNTKTCEGSWHLENTILSDRSCTTMSFDKTLEPQTENLIRLIFYESLDIGEGDIYTAYIHDKDVSIPKFSDRTFLTQANGDTTGQGKHTTFIIRLDVEKHIKIKTDEEDSCLTESELKSVKDMNQCIEESLTEGEHCILPWMSIDGDECKTLNQTRKMISKIHRKVGTDCKLRRHCIQWEYKTTSGSYSMPSSYALIKVFLPLVDDVPIREQKIAESPLQRLFQNEAASSIIQLLADMGGCLGIVWDVSLLWLLQSMTGGIVRLLFKLTHKESEERSETEIYTNMNAAAATIVSLSCNTFFFLVANALLTFLWSDSKVIINESGNNVPYRYPSISFCTRKKNDTFERLYYDSDKQLPSDYMKYMFMSTAEAIVSCEIKNVSCSDMGLHFTEEHFSEMSCQTLDTSSIENTTMNQLEIRLNPSTMAFITLIFLHDNYRLPYYATEYDDNALSSAMYESVRLSFTVIQTRVLPDCNNDYFQCLEDCFDRLLLDAWRHFPDDCVASVREIPGIPKCKTGRDAFRNILIRSEAMGFSKAKCYCKRPCLQTSYHKWHMVQRSLSGDSSIIINLKAVMVSEEREEYVYSVQKLLIQVGGLMGIIIGTSLLPMIQTLTLPLLLLPSNKWTRILYNLIRTVTLLGMWTFFVYQAFLEVRSFFEFRAQTTEAFKLEDTLLLPDITVCLADDLSRMAPIWKTTWGFTIRKCHYNLTCSPYIDLQHRDFLEFQETMRQFQIERNLQGCTVWGQSCMGATGEFYSWETLHEVNGYCSTLRLKALKNTFHVQSDVVIQMKSNFILYVKSKTEAFSKYNMVEAVETIKKTKQKYRVHAKAIHLISNSVNQCVEDVTYNRDKCFKHCYDSKITNALKCVLPWMTSFSESRPCIDLTIVYNGIRLIDMVDPYFDDTCNCPVSCNTQIFSPELYQYEDEQESSSVELHFQHETYVITNTIEYQFTHLWANVGGLVTLLVGKNVWDLGLFLVDLYEKYMQAKN